MTEPGAGRIPPKSPTTPPPTAAAAARPTTVTTQSYEINGEPHTALTVDNPQPKGTTQGLPGRAFSLNRSNTNPETNGVNTALDALQLPRTISRNFGTGDIAVSFTIGKDGRVSSVTIDTTNFTPNTEAGLTVKDAANWIAGRLANLRFTPGKTEMTVASTSPGGETLNIHFPPSSSSIYGH